jgi:flagellar biosynthesis/type III secretory pathway protein FliH
LKSIAHMLEEFGGQTRNEAIHIATTDPSEESRLADFENGYQAGWDDASAAHAAEQAHISSDFSQNLQALSFTYNEAYSHILSMLKPLLTQMVETILPNIAHETLGARIVMEIMELGRLDRNQRIDLIMSSESRKKLEKLHIKDQSKLFQLIGDDSLGDGQVFIRFGRSELRIDLDSLLLKVNSEIEEFLRDIEKRAENG